MDQFSEFTRPGAFLVDVLPVLRHFPSWFPGAGFKAKVPAWAKTMNDMADVPLEFVKDQMVGLLALDHSILSVDGWISINSKEAQTFQTSLPISWRVKISAPKENSISSGLRPHCMPVRIPFLFYAV